MALEAGFEPTTRTPSTCRSTSELLQRVDPTPGIEPGRGGSADRRLPIWQGRVVVWHQGKDLNPHPVVQSHVSYRLDHPGVWCVCGALDGDRTRLELLDRQPSPPEDREGVKEKSVVVVRRGGFAPPQLIATGLQPAGLACARAGARSTTHRFWLAMPIRFSMCGPGSREKEKGPGVARPLVDS